MNKHVFSRRQVIKALFLSLCGRKPMASVRSRWEVKGLGGGDVCSKSAVGSSADGRYFLTSQIALLTTLCSVYARGSTTMDLLALSIR